MKAPHSLAFGLMQVAAVAVVVVTQDTTGCCCCCRRHTTQDDDYKAAGAKIVDKAACFQADIVLKVKPPSLKEADMLKERAR